MARLLNPVLALLLLVGAGFVTRPLFRSWLDSSLKEAEAANRKQFQDWKPVSPKITTSNIPPLYPPTVRVPSTNRRQPTVNTIR